MSTTHFVADTYPYNPGVTSRAGNPCSSGNGSPFIPIASIAPRARSCAAATGVPEVHPSTLVQNNCSAPGFTPASASRSAKSTPTKFDVDT
ncbi:hypothetical protein GCM10027258_40400 [Amycolatopsis stemonae]